MITRDDSGRPCEERRKDSFVKDLLHSPKQQINIAPNGFWCGRCLGRHVSPLRMAPGTLPAGMTCESLFVIASIPSGEKCEKSRTSCDWAVVLRLSAVFTEAFLNQVSMLLSILFNLNFNYSYKSKAFPFTGRHTASSVIHYLRTIYS